MQDKHPWYAMKSWTKCWMIANKAYQLRTIITFRQAICQKRLLQLVLILRYLWVPASNQLVNTKETKSICWMRSWSNLQKNFKSRMKTLRSLRRKRKWKRCLTIKLLNRDPLQALMAPSFKCRGSIRKLIIKIKNSKCIKTTSKSGTNRFRLKIHAPNFRHLIQLLSKWSYRHWNRSSKTRCYNNRSKI